MTNEEKLRETFPKTIFIFRKNSDDLTTAIKCSDEWLQADYDQMYKNAEPCEDAVSKSKFDLRVREAVGMVEEELTEDFKDGIKMVLELLKTEPPVIPKQRLGHWVEIGDEPYDTWECDNCGFVIDGSDCVDPEEYRDVFKYCPNCGAMMEGKQE